jgi:predicted MFS family arabinose efflux permease
MSAEGERIKVLSAGVFSLILVMGVARFSYTPLLPLMQKQAGLGIAEAGFLAAVNYAGYLAGAIITSLVSDVKLKDRLYRIGLIVAIVSTWMMGASTNPLMWEISRFLAGLGTAAGMLLGSGLVLNWLMMRDHRSELGVHFSGVGLGIALCSAAVALMTPALDWREQWYVFTIIGCVLLVPAWAWLPKQEHAGVRPTHAGMQDRPPTTLFLSIFMAAYFCAGIGYVVSATFIVSIVDELPGMAGRGTLVFLIIGLAGAPSCVIWDLIARKTGDLNALIVAATLQIVGILLPVWPGGLACALIGSVLFGGTVMGFVSLVLTMAGRYYPMHPAKMIGKMSIAYGSAQIIGPAVTGWLARGGGGYAKGLYMAAAVLGFGVLLLFVLRFIGRDKSSSMEAAPHI